VTPGRRALRDRLAASIERLRDAVARADSPDEPTEPGEWSVREVVLHLVAVERLVWQARLETLVDAASGEIPHWTWTEPSPSDAPDIPTAAGAVTAFTAYRTQTVARIDALDEEGWSRRGRHDTYGELDVAGLIRVALDHDEAHLRPLERPPTGGLGLAR
jgi:hypothetical protein